MVFIFPLLNFVQSARSAAALSVENLNLQKEKRTNKTKLEDENKIREQIHRKNISIYLYTKSSCKLLIMLITISIYLNT
jgi:hypothetical protein